MDRYHSHLYHESFETQKGRIVVWKSAEYLKNIHGSLKKKELEKLEIIRMLNVLGYAITDLYYKESGQPMLNEDSIEYISLSHSQGWFAIYLANQPVGIDVEVDRENINLGKSWFLNEDEMPLFINNDALHIVWGAKEAFYKMKEGKITDLREEVTVKQLSNESTTVLHNNQETLLFHKKIQNIYIVWS